MTHARLTEPSDGTKHWQSDLLKPVLDEYGTSLDAFDGGPVPTIASAASTTLLWDGTNGGTADALGRQGINTAQWTAELGGGQPPDSVPGNGDNLYNRWGNFEAQNYTSRLKNLCVRGGVLTLRAFKEPGTITSPVAGQPAADFSSAKVNSQGKVTVPVGAYVEARITMPVTPGAWAAFWTMGANFTRTAPDANGRTLTNWPYCGEIDTIETFGQHPHKAGFALHMTTTAAPNDTTTAKPDLYVGWDNSTALYESPTLDISRPTYYGFWNSGTEIRRYINRRETFRYTQAQATAAGAAWPFNQPQFLILNLAVGGQAEGKVSGQAPGVPSFIDAGMGAAMTVEPIRVWNSVTSPTTLGLQ